MHSALSSTLAFAPLLLLVAAPVDAATPPWEGPAPLSADPAAVLGAANAIATPEDHGSHVLYDDVRVEIDDAGRAKRTAYRVVRVTDQRDVERWSQVGATWAPWHQERPQLEARVIGPDGRVHTLAANTFAEQPVAGSSRDMYTDRRKLVAPLPGLRAGAVLEVVSRTADKSPFFRAGNSGRYGLLFGVPVLRSRVRVSAPRAAPLRVEVEGLDKPRLRRSTRKGRQEVTLQSGPHGSVDDVPFLTPPEAEPWPAVAWTTLPSWAAVVEGYQTLLPSVEAGRAEVADRVAAVIAGATTRRERIERLVAALHGWARYTGLELGDASIIPRRPAETLERGYGDCKDKAFLLVSALAAADIEAHLALLRVSGTDARPKRPAFGVFDHAITFVPGDPPLWIDATADRVRVGELPVQDLDRHALVIAPTTRGLVRTPPRRAQDHTITWRRDVTVQRDATTSVSETIRWTGAAEQSFRAGDHARSPEARREHWQEHTTTSWGGQLAKLDPVATPPLTTPAEVHLTVTDAPIAANEDHRYVVHLEYSRLFHWMNNVLTSAPKAKGEAEREDTEGWLDRTVDLYLQPHRMRLIYTVRAGPGLVPVDLPPSRVWELGPARVIEKFARNADDSVTVDLSYRSGPARMTPAQVRAYRAGVIEYLAAPTPTVQFEDRAQALLAAGRTVDAIAELQRLQDVEPDRAIHGQVFVEALLELGLVDEARASAAALAARLPSSRDAWFAVGRAASFGAAGIYRGSGIDIAAARDAFEEALRLEPDSPGAEENLVLVLASDPSFLPAGASGPAGRAADAGDGWVKRGIADDASRGMVVQANIAARRLERALEIAGGPTPGNLLGSGQVLSARALLETPDAALAEAQRRWPDTGQRGKALVAGGSQLTLLREYAAAAALMGPNIKTLKKPNTKL